MTFRNLLRCAAPVLFLTAALALPLLSAHSASAEDKANLSNDKQKYSYIIGSNIGRQMKNDGIDLDSTTFLSGLNDGLAGKESPLTQEEVRAVMTKLQASLQAAHEAKSKAAGDTNQKAGDAFLAKNKTSAGVKTTASGLQYKVLKEGTGKKATLADTVTANYRGTLIDGTEFDSSYKRGEPAKFPVTGVIPGWTEVLQLMKIGSKYQVFIPASLAYGERGAGDKIGPNSTLIFEIELLDAKQE